MDKILKTSLIISEPSQLVNHNLVEGDVAYIDNGHATIALSKSWLGSVVDSIIWQPQYNSDDRRWSVDKQKYIYRNNNLAD